MRDFSRTRLVRVAGVADGRRTRGIACGSSDMWVVGHVAWIRPTDGGATFGMSASGGGDCARGSNGCSSSSGRNNVDTTEAVLAFAYRDAYKCGAMYVIQVTP